MNICKVNLWKILCFTFRSANDENEETQNPWTHCRFSYWAIHIDWIIWNTAEPQTTKMKRPKSHGPTVDFSASAAFWKLNWGHFFNKFIPTSFLNWLYRAKKYFLCHTWRALSTFLNSFLLKFSFCVHGNKLWVVLDPSFIKDWTFYPWVKKSFYTFLRIAIMAKYECSESC